MADIVAMICSALLVPYALIGLGVGLTRPIWLFILL